MTHNYVKNLLWVAAGQKIEIDPKTAQFIVKKHIGRGGKIVAKKTNRLLVKIGELAPKNSLVLKQGVHIFIIDDHPNVEIMGNVGENVHIELRDQQGNLSGRIFIAKSARVHKSAKLEAKHVVRK